ncbi:hypothetical protein [Archangium lansingense]|uniref:Uncharacterized protein n=1 Tax=Archangium lansingense TaxID=2995310 RepID=A0ABT4AER5_9BACT|nr:hypothetical protein [Archangium lansinium]MCY1080176.1 hypothetical protein [Archangium lansinium]
MKNAEGVALASDLDRRLKTSIDQLRDVRETLEELGRSAGTLHRLFGVEEVQEVVRGKGGRTPTPKGQTVPPPAPSARPAPSSAPTAPAPQDDIPEWRKVFPNLSSKVPGRGK